MRVPAGKLSERGVLAAGGDWQEILPFEDDLAIARDLLAAATSATEDWAGTTESDEPV